MRLLETCSGTRCQLLIQGHGFEIALALSVPIHVNFVCAHNISIQFSCAQFAAWTWLGKVIEATSTLHISHLDAHDKLTRVVGAECNSKVNAVRRHCLADWVTNFDCRICTTKITIITKLKRHGHTEMDGFNDFYVICFLRYGFERNVLKTLLEWRRATLYPCEQAVVSHYSDL